MDITELLFKAMTLLGLGMTFVFLFLGLLMIAINLMAIFVPPDKVIENRKINRNNSTVETHLAGTSPQVVAAITSAITQYRKTETV